MEAGIIGGKEVEPHSRPYMVSLQLNKAHQCGGMLIRKDYVLTSAHCVNKIKCPGNNRLEVVLGAHNLKKHEIFQQRIQVMECIKHPLYVPTENHHDIMLLKLKTKAVINKFVKTIALPKENKKIIANQECSIAGWGMKSPNSSASDVLQEVTLKVQFDFECRNIWQKYFDVQHMICTVSDGKRAFCQGDSGSPLICKNKPQGIATYTYLYDCSSRKYPQVYIKISYFVPWINKTIGATESGIIGGNEAKPHSRPYMVSFQHKKVHVCNYKSSWRKRMDVVLGAHNISKKESSQQRIQVKKYITHPSYKTKQNDWTYDIMLLKLKTKAKLGNSVNVIALPEKNTEVSANQTCSIAGWGSPLICNNKPQGIATFSYNDCLNHNFPEVYIKVAYFIPWINKVINSD
ncbi:hypothetical protein NFI96_012112 [Prochilodus magdalenae]|nr:hypothetical protein NFI96_012112 [Prochilodus magdalenae]